MNAATLAVLLFLSPGGGHEETEISCPAQIDVFEVVDDVPGWEKKAVKSTRRLGGATYFDGPSESMMQFSSPGVKEGDDLVFYWETNDTDIGFTISCNYERSATTLERRVLHRSMRCELRTNASIREMTFSCKDIKKTGA